MKKRNYANEVARMCEALAAGTITDEQLELAAYLGDPIAHEVSGQSGACPKLGRLGMHGGDQQTALRRWVFGLAKCGRPAVIRAAVAAADLARSYAKTECSWAHEASTDAPLGTPRCVCDGFKLVRQALRDWLRCPCDEHLTAPEGLGSIEPPRPADITPSAFAELFDAEASAEDLARRLGFLLQTSCDGWVSHPHRMGWCFGADETQLAMRDVLLPWALGQSDPAVARSGPATRQVSTQLWLNDRLVAELDGGETLGRDARCDVHVDDLTVSNRHVQFEGRAGRVWVRDLGSTNGTRIEVLGAPWLDASTTPGVLLQDGRRLRLGTLEFEVRVSLARARARATATPIGRRSPSVSASAA